MKIFTIINCCVKLREDDLDHVEKYQQKYEKMYTSGFYDLVICCSNHCRFRINQVSIYNCWCFRTVHGQDFLCDLHFFNLDCNWPSMILGCWAKLLFTLMLTPAFTIYIIVRCTCQGERCDTVICIKCIHSASIMLICMRTPSTMIHIQKINQLGNFQDAEGVYVVHVSL